MHPPGGAPQKVALPGVKHLIAIASGKGGVGKSTVAGNLAVALALQGNQVGLMDADLYGPTIPTMMGAPADFRQSTAEPLVCHGVKLMSMAFMMPAGEAAAMRGPMIHKYLVAFLTQIEWGQLDYLLVDMPPGTGDAYLSLGQAAPVTGAVVVVTPQDVSLKVARRGVEMFNKLQIPVLGIVENMSYFVSDDGKRHALFGQGGGKQLAQEAGAPLLAELPVDPRVAQCGDAGVPIVKQFPESAVAKAYLQLAIRLGQEAARRGAAPELPTLDL